MTFKPNPTDICGYCGGEYQNHGDPSVFVPLAIVPKNDAPAVSLPEENRDDYPMAEGLLDYFPNALAEVARHSLKAVKQHNLPGLGWDRTKSRDHRNKIARHLADTGKRDELGNRHSAALAWRALALLQEELEADEDYPTPRGARA